MATFPSLEPTTRSLTLGDTPQLVHAATSGANVRFLMGTDRLQQRLQITYEYLTEAEAKLLLDHYAGQEGGLIPFDLSTQVWSGYTSAPVSSSDFQWTYSKTFEIGVGAPMQYNCLIDLETVPI